MKTRRNYCLLLSPLLLIFGHSGHILAASGTASEASIEKTCITRIENEFARTSYGWDDLAKYELRKTKAYIVNNVPGESAVQQLLVTSLKADALFNNVSKYTFLIKRDLCLPENEIDLEALVRLKVAEHSAEIYAEVNAPIQAQIKSNFNTIIAAQSREAIVKEYLETKLSYDPRARAADKQLKAIGAKLIRDAIKSGFFKNNLAKTSPENVFQAVKNHFMDSLKLGSATVGHGNMWQSPDPSSISMGTRVEIKGLIDTLALMFGEENLPEFWKERLLLETGTDITFFNNGSITRNQITSLNLSVGDSDIFYRDTISNFSDENKEACSDSSHCEKSQFRSFGFRWNARDPLKYRSNVYFEYDLIKMTGNQDFESNVIKQTSASNPHWPLLRRLRAPEKENPGLLLGYIVRTGFTAQIADKVPQLIPFLKKKYGGKTGKLEVFSEARLFGSTVFTDDADSLDLEFGFQIRYPNQILIGFKTVYSAEVGGHDDSHFKDGRNKTTGMVFVTIPLKEPNYIDEEFVDGEYSDKFEVTKVELFTKKYGINIPIHFNIDEKKQKSMETGINVAAAWGRFIYEIMLMQVHGKDSPVDSNVQGYQSGRIAVKYELNPKIRIVAEGIGDNFEGGHFQPGFGVQLKPLAGVKADPKDANAVDISISGMYHPTSSYCATVRCNQVDVRTGNLNLHRNWSLSVDVNKPFDIYKLTEWTGIKGEVGLQNRLYMRNMDFGYYSVIFNAGFSHEGLGIRTSFSPYGQDFNFGAPSGTGLFHGPGMGITGTHQEKSMNIMWDLLKTKRFVWPNDETPSKSLLPAKTNEPISAKKPELIIDINDLPSQTTDNEKVYKWLAEIAQIWESGNSSPEAYELYETVPYLVLNIAQRKFWNAKWAFSRRAKDPSIAFEDIRRIYDPEQDYFIIELENDKRLESLLRNVFSKHSRWKESIQVVARKLYSEALYCTGISKIKSGNVIDGEKLINESQYELPGWAKRKWNEAYNSEIYCQ